MNRVRFRINEPDVSTEDFKSEILAVNLQNGYYHSLRGGAIPVWRLLTEGFALDTVVTWLSRIYGIPEAQLEPELEALVRQLQEAELIREESSTEPTDETRQPAWLSEISSNHPKPVLETYTEMRDLLLLDPIHDVDTKGWPHQRIPEPDQH